MLTAAHCPGWPRAERPQTNGPSAPASLGDGRAVAVSSPSARSPGKPTGQTAARSSPRRCTTSLRTPLPSA